MWGSAFVEQGEESARQEKPLSEGHGNQVSENSPFAGSTVQGHHL